jgi:hypothetical protein
VLATTIAAAALFPGLQDLLDCHPNCRRLFAPLLAQGRGTRLPHLGHPMLNSGALRVELVEVEAGDVDGHFDRVVLRALHCRSPSPNRRTTCGTTRSDVIADANTDQVWEFPEKALTSQWAFFPGLGMISP